MKSTAEVDINDSNSMSVVHSQRPIIQ